MSDPIDLRSNPFRVYAPTCDTMDEPIRPATSFRDAVQRVLPVDADTALRLETALHQLGGSRYEGAFEFWTHAGPRPQLVYLTLRRRQRMPPFYDLSFVYKPADWPGGAGR